MRKFISIPLVLLFAVVCVNSAYADVEVVDGNINSEESGAGFSSGIIEDGGSTNNTEPGDFVIIHCATENDSQLQTDFLPPSPGDWNPLDTGNGDCGNEGCVQGVWGKFADTGDAQDITCSWDESLLTFAAGSYRFRNVDVDDPIIDVECQSGSSDLVVAPSIEVEPGSQVYALATISAPTEFDCDFLEEEFTLELYLACANREVENITVTAQTFSSPLGGPTGDIELPLLGLADWRACTIGIRMDNSVRPIPTISEWGFLAVAVFMGAAGVWYLRRRQAA